MNRATGPALIAQAESGWREGFKTKRDKNGKVSILNKGGLVDEALYGANPFEWAKKHVIPDMVKKGLLPEGFARGDYSQDLNDAQRSGGAKYLSERFSNRRGANIFTMMVQDIEQLDKTIQQRNKARGTADILTDQKRDIITGTEAVKAQAAGAASALSAPSMEKLAAALDRVTTNLSRTADFLEKNPVAAQSAFAGSASVVGGLATAGAAALTIAAVTSLTLPALAIGSIAGLTIGTFLFPWEELYRKMGWTPGVALGGKNDAIKNLDAIGALPGVDGPNLLRQKAGTQGLGLTPENVAEAIKRQSELAGRAALDAGKLAGAETTKGFGAGDFLGAGSKAASSLLSGFLSILSKMGEANAGVSPISFGGGGLGGLIHKASLSTGSNDNISVGGGPGRSMGSSRGFGGGSDGGQVNLIGGSAQDRAHHVMNRLIGKGWTREAAATAAGNFVQESGVQPNGRSGDGGTAHGLAQWRFDRWDAAKAHMRANPNLSPLDAQIDFFDMERKRRGGLQAQMHALKDVNAANRAMFLYERYGDKSLGTRAGNARGLLRSHRGGEVPIAPLPNAVPPPRRPEPPGITHVHLDGKTIARAVTTRIASEGRYPSSAGRMDTHGTWSPPSHQGSDAA